MELRKGGPWQPKLGETLAKPPTSCLDLGGVCVYSQVRSSLFIRAFSPAPTTLSMAMQEASSSFANSCTAWLGSSYV
ncbi:hypothetical protein EYF80_010398 [Liparis tanakae]|uniref:Uncharacterized protein n=1 Tax=Liparis tanakae TaxID=230148 RepID=A0A4Z2IPI8_9TELE|nr:hypothetical protein EYF80_010398 [Liparis tanakae]